MNKTFKILGCLALSLSTAYVANAQAYTHHDYRGSTFYLTLGTAFANVNSDTFYDKEGYYESDPHMYPCHAGASLKSCYDPGVWSPAVQKNIIGQMSGKVNYITLGQEFRLFNHDDFIFNTGYNSVYVGYLLHLHTLKDSKEFRSYENSLNVGLSLGYETYPTPNLIWGTQVYVAALEGKMYGLKYFINL